MKETSQKKPLISVIIPLYNKGPYVKRAIQSVLNQNVSDFEIIVIDGGSRDNGPDEVRSFADPRLSLVRQVEKGVSAARNEAVQLTNSDFIAFLDADDEWRPEFIETVLRLRGSFPDAGMYFVAIQEIQLDTTKKTYHYSFVPRAGWEGLVDNYFGALMCEDPLYFPSSLAIRKDVFIEYKGFPQGSSWGEDQDLCGRIALRHPVAFSSRICTLMHKTDEYSHAMNRRIATTEEHPFIRPALAAIEMREIPDSRVPDLKRWIKALIVFSVKYNLIAGNPKGARGILKQYGNELVFPEKMSLKFWSMMPAWTFNIGGHSFFQVCRSSVGFLKQTLKH